MSRTGWPRPFTTWYPSPNGQFTEQKPRRLPLPWVNDEKGGFLVFNRDSTRAHDERLCAVCGESLKWVIVLGAVFDVSTPETNGPGCHPRCFALALQFCPHFAARYPEEEIVAFVYRGWGRGYVLPEGDDPFTESRMTVDSSAEPVTWEQCRRLARENPLGSAE